MVRLTKYNKDIDNKRTKEKSVIENKKEENKEWKEYKNNNDSN